MQRCRLKEYSDIAYHEHEEERTEEMCPHIYCLIVDHKKRLKREGIRLKIDSVPADEVVICYLPGGRFFNRPNVGISSVSSGFVICRRFSSALVCYLLLLFLRRSGSCPFFWRPRSARCSDFSSFLRT